MGFNVSSEVIDITTWLNDGYRKFEAGRKSWNITFDTIYVEDDEGQQRVYEAIENCERFYTKFLTTRNFKEDGFRRAKIGLGYITSDTLHQSKGSAVTGNFSFIGTGPFKDIRENATTALSCDFCCIESHTTLYLNNGDTFLAEPAPDGSTGWVLEVNFQPTVIGTGDIGEFYVQGVGPGTSGCPIQVTYRYLCENSAYVPDSGGSPFDQFIEIAENTTNPAQQDIIAIMEAETGLTVGIGGITYQALYLSWNFDFLFNNPDYILDVSGYGLSDAYIIGTFTNLKGLDISFNNLTFDDINQLDDLSLVYFDGSHNLFGQNDTFASSQIDTLKHVDVSYNYIVEVYAFESSGIDLDYLDIGHNIIAYLRIQGRRVKDLRMAFNTYPRDNATGGFWEALIGDVGSPIMVAYDSPLIIKDFTITENIDWSESELLDEEADYATIIAQIMVDQAITEGEAKTIFPYNPTYLDTANNRSPFNQLQLPRGGH